MLAPLQITRAEDLDTAAVLAVVAGRRLSLSAGLLDRLALRHREMLECLRTGARVYGVNTGVGDASRIELDDAAQVLLQNNLMLAPAVGSAPWLDERETRAIIAVRLRTFLTGDAAVSPELCRRLVDLLDLEPYPAIPRGRCGTAGEIIPLAHLGGCLTGSGEFLRAGRILPARDVLAAAGLPPYRLAPKEGLAMIEGVPVTTALAMLRAREARLLADQAVVVVSAGLALVAASRDPFSIAVARADEELARVLRAVCRLAGPEPLPHALQAPLSFRVAGPAVAQLLRAVDAVHNAVTRASAGVTDSPAFVDGRFVGTAGFDGFDLAAALDGLRVSLIHLAEVSAARLHRLLDDRFTGLPRQLSDAPGLHAGMVVVHKRAVGVTHGLLACARPASLGTVETALGHEDVQSFSVESAVSCADAVAGARDVLACELLALVQGMRLVEGPRIEPGSELGALFAELDAALPPGTADRPFGRDVAAIAAILEAGWAERSVAEPRIPRGSASATTGGTTGRAIRVGAKSTPTPAPGSFVACSPEPVAIT